ncbi:integrase core domain-containing protein [Caldisericum sp.]
MEYYNNRRPHQSLGNRTPAEYYYGKSNILVQAG